MLQELRFGGKAVVVTGAGQGIGQATAEVLAELGAVVYAVDINPKGLEETAALITDAGGRCEPIEGDTTSEDDAAKLHDRIVADGATLKSLVNNVGVNLIKPADEMTLEEWNRVITINLTGGFLQVRSLLPLLLDAPGGGTVVNVSSGFGLIGGPNMPPYSSSKAGLIGFTKQLSVDYSARGLRANAICPGLTYSPRVKGYVESGSIPKDEIFARVLEHRGAECREIANVIAFAASDAASYMTGAVIAVDGGQTAA